MIKNPTTDIYINQQLQKRYKVNHNYDNIFQDSVSGSVCHAMTWISHKIQVMWKWSNCFNVFKGSPLVRTETESKCPNLSHWHFTFPNISNISMPFVCVHTKRWAIVHADSQALALINGKVTVKCYYLHLFSWFHGSHLWKRFGFFLLFFFFQFYSCAPNCLSPSLHL